MVVPQRLDLLEAMQPQVVGIEENAELHRQYKTWNESVIHFTQRLRERDPEAVKLGWQRYYFTARLRTMARMIRRPRDIVPG